MESDERNPMGSAGWVDDETWGASQRGPEIDDDDREWFRRRGDRQGRRVRREMLPRDSDRDPWGGKLVQDVDELASGYYEHVDPVPSRGPRSYYIDDATGGMAGVLDSRSRGIHAGYGPASPRDLDDETHVELDNLFDSPAERMEANRYRYAGRAPRGYRRADARILEDVHERLTEHGGVDPSDVEVSVENGEVRLTGTVEDRETKRLVERVAESVAGVRDVHNELRLRRGAGEGGS
jgi:hypothetical protein